VSGIALQTTTAVTSMPSHKEKLARLHSLDVQRFWQSSETKEYALGTTAQLLAVGVATDGEGTASLGLPYCSVVVVLGGLE
jgi:hypothetical protein